MSHTYRLSGQAKAELADIWLYIALDNPAAADRQIDAVTAKLRLLARNPRAGRARRDLGPQLRSTSVGNYVIVYRLDGNAVHVVHVFHGSRDIGGLL